MTKCDVFDQLMVQMRKVNSVTRVTGVTLTVTLRKNTEGLFQKSVTLCDVGRTSPKRGGEAADGDGPREEVVGI